MNQVQTSKWSWALRSGIAAGLVALPLSMGMGSANTSGTCPPSDGMMGGEMMGGMGPQMMRDMGPIHGLFAEHTKIHRTVEDIPRGIRSTTTSEDPKVAAMIRAHVWQMKERLARGDPIRMMDPLFREIFKHHGEVRLDVAPVPGGVRVTETSADPQVILLIRQHAHRAVSEFVEGGMRRAMQPTPLPPGYEASSDCDAS